MRKLFRIMTLSAIAVLIIAFYACLLVAFIGVRILVLLTSPFRKDKEIIL